MAKQMLNVSKIDKASLKSVVQSGIKSVIVVQWRHFVVFYPWPLYAFVCLIALINLQQRRIYVGLETSKSAEEGDKGEEHYFRV